MWKMPNYEYPCEEIYWILFDFEIFLVQLVERLRDLGNLGEASLVVGEKKMIHNRRMCYKAACLQAGIKLK